MELKNLQDMLDLIKKRKEFLCNDHPGGRTRYEQIMHEINKVIETNRLSPGETKDFFSLACVLNSIKNNDFRDITSSWIVSENQNR